MDAVGVAELTELTLRRLDIPLLRAARKDPLTSALPRLTVLRGMSVHARIHVTYREISNATIGHCIRGTAFLDVSLRAYGLSIASKIPAWEGYYIARAQWGNPRVVRGRNGMLGWDLHLSLTDVLLTGLFIRAVRTLNIERTHIMTRARPRYRTQRTRCIEPLSSPCPAARGASLATHGTKPRSTRFCACTCSIYCHDHMLQKSNVSFFHHLTSCRTWFIVECRADRNDERNDNPTR